MKLPLMTFNTALLVAASASLPACAIDATNVPHDDEHVGDTAAALSVAGGATWGTPGNNGADLQLGPTSSQTCFLSGVSGDLIGDPFMAQGPNGLPFGPHRASAEVFMNNGFWFVRTRAGIGPGVAARVTCINATANRVEFSWQDNLTIQGVPATPNRHCFLRKVWATSGLSGQVGGLRTNLTIRNVGGQFDMNGSFVENIGGDSEFGGATAVCVDLPNPTGQWGFTLTGPSSGSNTITLRNFFPNGPPVPVANVGCFMTAIAGRWISPQPDPQGWNDGVFLTGDTSVSPNWLMTASNGRTGSASCVR